MNFLRLALFCSGVFFSTLVAETSDLSHELISVREPSGDEKYERRPAPQQNQSLNGSWYNGKYSRFSLGGNYTYARVHPRGSSATDGSLGGLQTSYEYRRPNFVYVGANFSWRDGSTNRSTAKRSLQDFNIQEVLGYMFDAGCRYRVASYSGVGCRVLDETTSQGSTSIDFDYTEFYIPVGLLFDGYINKYVSWGFNVQWRPQIFSFVKISPQSGTRWTLKNRVNNFYIESPLTIYISQKGSLIFSPFFETWGDGQSTATTAAGLSLGLPRNSYIFAGINVNVFWEF